MLNKCCFTSGGNKGLFLYWIRAEVYELKAILIG